MNCLSHSSLQCLIWVGVILLGAVSALADEPTSDDNGERHATLPVASPVDAAQLQQAVATWQGHIVPILTQHCVGCHGAIKKRGGLDLRDVQSIGRGGESGPAIVPGAAADSLMVQLLQPGADRPMPPPEKPPLTDAQRQLIASWLNSLTPEMLAEWPTPGSEAAWAANFALATPAGENNTAHPPLRLPQSLNPAQAIDVYIAQGWEQAQVTPSPVCSDQDFVRRIYLDLLGRIPTQQEWQEFLTESDSQKRSQLIERLLASPEHAQHMAEWFSVVLLGRGTEVQHQQRKEHGWQAYLEAAFYHNRPWNEIVAEMIEARPSFAERRGAVWFLYERENKHQEIAEAVGPAVFGIQVQCAQCHDHPLLPELKQAHYWGLVAFFKRSQNTMTSSGPAVAESAIGGFDQFKNLSGEAQDAQLTFLDAPTVPETKPTSEPMDADELYEPASLRLSRGNATSTSDPAHDKQTRVPPLAPTVASAAANTQPNFSLDAQPRIPKFSRRSEFVTRVIAPHPRVARAQVNRLWAKFMGRGLVHPIDEMDSRHPPSHPELLDWLAAAYKEHHYDNRWLIRAIVNSRAYQLDGVPSDKQAQPYHFAHGLQKPLTAEMLVRSLQVALHGDVSELEVPFSRRLRELFPSVQAPSFQAQPAQALFLSNNATVQQWIDQSPLAARLDSLHSAGDKTELLFTAILGRPPAAEERQALFDYWQVRLDRTPAANRQILWSLLMSAEFWLNH